MIETILLCSLSLIVGCCIGMILYNNKTQIPINSDIPLCKKIPLPDGNFAFVWNSSVYKGSYSIAIGPTESKIGDIIYFDGKYFKKVLHGK